ncbi:MAG: 16S rRNA (cytidine(1402)-2'-O)-methyltransferase [Actinomycetales bacterium]|nr:MAG: 16S rRNA (cytidine(1402)-2'-O)-methyltransferase [Actinomycetales bacterium]
MTSGTLVLAATPIGDVHDASSRLADELAGADVIAAEDTRRLRRLCNALRISPEGTVLSYHEHNEASRTGELLDRLRDGDRIVLVADAGMPSVSDPGFRLVAAAAADGIPVTAVPGPSAVLTALALSGLPVDRFCFEGFLPRRAGERAHALAALADERRTMVFFEAPHRLAQTLAALAEVFGPDRPAAVCRELTKTWEEVRRASLGELTEWAGAGVKGEITVVVAGSSATASRTAAELADVVAGIRERAAAGERLKDVCAEVALDTGISRKSLYDAAVRRADTSRAPDASGARRPV